LELAVGADLPLLPLVFAVITSHKGRSLGADCEEFHQSVLELAELSGRSVAAGVGGDPVALLKWCMGRCEDGQSWPQEFVPTGGQIYESLLLEAVWAERQGGESVLGRAAGTPGFGYGAWSYAGDLTRSYLHAYCDGFWCRDQDLTAAGQALRVMSGLVTGGLPGPESAFNVFDGKVERCSPWWARFADSRALKEMGMWDGRKRFVHLEPLVNWRCPACSQWNAVDIYGPGLTLTQRLACHTRGCLLHDSPEWGHISRAVLESVTGLMYDIEMRAGADSKAVACCFGRSCLSFLVELSRYVGLERGELAVAAYDGFPRFAQTICDMAARTDAAFRPKQSWDDLMILFERRPPPGSACRAPKPIV
jgi:hypothetical protein